jgi:putative polyhydroxyalkanoate system protein
VPKISMEIPHELSAEEAKQRIERKGEFLLSQFGDKVKDMSTTWAGNALSFGFKTLGMRIDGIVSVEDDKVSVNCDLPFAAMMFKGRIESEIRQQLERILRV